MKTVPSSFPIVGIGASAGGLDAFRRLLGALPVDGGMAYVLVQHLDPRNDSILAELLSETTQMAVSEVKGDVHVEPNRVYVIPPSKDMVLDDGMLKLVPRSSTGAAHMPIDSFFRTLAEMQGARAIGVILSGMGSDGTLGAHAIEAEGGIVFAQDPTTAQSKDMPTSAIDSGRVDFILAPEGIARELARLGRHPYLVSGDGSPTAPAAANDDEHESLSRILEILRKARGTDFGAYKKTTLRRRIARRMAVSCIETLAEYESRLDGDAAETNALYDDCLISVTSFFRDPQVFQALREQILPSLLTGRSADAPLRVWVAGCASGEEVYSIAMCLLERTAQLSRNPPLQIFATDLSESALSKAREGVYVANIARDVSAERLGRFFTKVGGGQYQITKAVRDMCVFARHDLTSDPPFSRLDLISSRNVLIYLEPRLQERVFATFHYALAPDGFLVVGPAETAGAASALFSTVDEEHRIYKKKAGSGAPLFYSVARDQSLHAPARIVARTAGVSEVPREVDRMLLARFAPAGVLVDENLRILEFRGDTDPFLEHGHGKASLNLERLLRKGLLMEVRRAVDEARQNDTSVRTEGLQVRYRDELRSVGIEVVPIKGRAAAERCLLVLFESEGNTSRRPDRSSPVHPPPDTADAKDQEIARLGQALAQASEYVDTLLREHESALEQLQSTNEEALSGNEELQSVNEELQTAKEEIQSTNEELATLNQELQDRNVQLARSNEEIQRALDSANALVDTVPQPLLILDGELRVEKANAAYYETFQTSAELTRGRQLSELGSGQWDSPSVLIALKAVFAEGASLEDFELDAYFPRLGTRTMSLNARRLHPELGARTRVILAIVDRTEVKAAERGRAVLLELEKEARGQAEAAAQLKDEFVATVSHELRGPLTVISGWVDILLAAGKSPDASKVKRALEAINRGVVAQNRLISDLLDHSRIVTGKVELQRAPVDLMVVADAALVGIGAAAAAKDIDVDLSGGYGTNIVLGDADRLQQVLWNLFLNAVKFTPPGGRVRIAIGRVANQIRTDVSDTGRGISEAFIPHVFERFRQAESSSSRAQPGLGLGLTLVRELVELHGGTVHVKSAGVDLGAVFTVVLPIPVLLLPPDNTDVEPESVEPDSVPPPRSIQAPPSYRPPHNILEGMAVLVVDDEVDARDALVSLLERYGAEVRPAASVAEAMTSLAVGLPDVLISDLGMPGEDGYELIRRVRLLPFDAGGRLPSLAVSAYATDEHRKKVMRTGFQKHLEKPVAPDELVTAVAHLGGRLDGLLSP